MKDIDLVTKIHALQQRIQEHEAQQIEIVEDEADMRQGDKCQALREDGDRLLPLETFEFETVTVNANGQIIQRAPGQARQFVETLGNDITLKMVVIPGGTFLMGQSEAEKQRVIELVGQEKHEKYYASEGPQHEVTVPPFLMGKYPITQAQWEIITGENPSNSRGAARPVEHISWNHAVVFCKKLTSITGHHYHLPSEAEWEYACRAGTVTPFAFGDTLTSELADYNGRHTYASEPRGQYRGETVDVGMFPPNAFGLYDMHGNVLEWCADDWHADYTGAPVNGEVWNCAGEPSTKVLRGGSWGSNPLYCRCACRGKFHFIGWSEFRGLRVVLRGGM